MDKTLLISLNSLRHNNILSYDTKNIINEAKLSIQKLTKEKYEIHNILFETLKAMVGKSIYWRLDGWKEEKHTITDIKCEIFDSDFFDTKDEKYKGTMQIIIEVDNSGNYLAKDIGKTLFFT